MTSVFGAISLDTVALSLTSTVRKPTHVPDYLNFIPSQYKWILRKNCLKKKKKKKREGRSVCSSNQNFLCAFDVVTFVFLIVSIIVLIAVLKIILQKKKKKKKNYRTRRQRVPTSTKALWLIQQSLNQTHFQQSSVTKRFFAYLQCLPIYDVWHQKIQQCPQFAQIILKGLSRLTLVCKQNQKQEADLQRRAGQQQPIGGAFCQLLQFRISLRLCVFDRMRFIEHQIRVVLRIVNNSTTSLIDRKNALLTNRRKNLLSPSVATMLYVV
jgi:hypothetical protein